MAVGVEEEKDAAGGVEQEEPCRGPDLATGRIRLALHGSLLISAE
jgi:hypothetical protein